MFGNNLVCPPPGEQLLSFYPFGKLILIHQSIMFSPLFTSVAFWDWLCWITNQVMWWFGIYDTFVFSTGLWVPWEKKQQCFNVFGLALISIRKIFVDCINAVKWSNHIFENPWHNSLLCGQTCPEKTNSLIKGQQECLSSLVNNTTRGDFRFLLL